MRVRREGRRDWRASQRYNAVRQGHLRLRARVSGWLGLLLTRRIRERLFQMAREWRSPCRKENAPEPSSLTGGVNLRIDGVACAGEDKGAVKAAP